MKKQAEDWYEKNKKYFMTLEEFSKLLDIIKKEPLLEKYLDNMHDLNIEKRKAIKDAKQNIRNDFAELYKKGTLAGPTLALKKVTDVINNRFKEIEEEEY